MLLQCCSSKPLQWWLTSYKTLSLVLIICFTTIGFSQTDSISTILRLSNWLAIPSLLHGQYFLSFREVNISSLPDIKYSQFERKQSWKSFLIVFITKMTLTIFVIQKIVSVIFVMKTIRNDAHYFLDYKNS